MKTWLGRGVALLAASLLSFALGEFLLRMIVPEESLGWQGVPPIEERIDSAPANDENAYRILALGDSFTEYLDDRGKNWARYFAARIEASGIPVELFNLGQMGTAPAHYAQNLREFGAQLAPDLVVVGLYLGNDFLDYEMDAIRLSRGEAPGPIETKGRRPSGLAATLKRNSLLLSTAWRIVRGLRGDSITYDQNMEFLQKFYRVDDATVRKGEERIGERMVALARSEKVNPWDVVWGALQPARYRELILLESEAQRDAMNAALDDIVAMHAEARTLGASFAVLLIPAGIQVAERYQDYFGQVGFEVGKPLLGDTPMMRAVKRSLDEEGILYADPIDELAASDTAAYLELDTHWTPTGQEIGGAVLFGTLTPKGLWAK